MASGKASFLRAGIGMAMLLWASILPASAQQIPLPGKEASPSIFSTQLGSPDVTLDLAGSWSSVVDGSLSWGLDSLTGRTYPAAFPGMVSGFHFQQIPNLDVTLRLYNRYFFRTSFVEPSTSTPSPNLPANLNTFLLGYDGRPGEFLQSVRIGNTDVNMAPTNFVSFPDASPFSLGASVRFATENASYEAMIRYEPSALHKRTFIGHTELSENRINPGSYVDGQYFVLPDPNVQNLTVYIEDGTGTILAQDGHYYRVAGSSDYSYSAANGTILFAKPLSGRALVSYTSNGSSVGSSSLGKGFLPTVTSGVLDPTAPRDFNFTAYPAFDVSIQGQGALLIYQPGGFADSTLPSQPFETANTYSLADTNVQSGSSLQASIVPSGADGLAASTQAAGSSGTPGLLAGPGGQALSVLFDANAKALTVIGPAASSAQAPYNPRALESRYPLATLSASLAEIYTSAVNRNPQSSGEQLLVRVSTPIQSYVLDPNIIKGSVHVTVNGRTENDFSVDYTNGYLNFTNPVADSDVIIITYRTMSTTEPGGDLLAGLGASFTLLPWLSLDLATGLRWSLFTSTYSTVEGTNTGSAIVGAGLHVDRENPNRPGERLKADVQAGLSLSSPDTTGTFLLFGMEGSGTGVPMAEGNMYPSSAPDATESGGFAGISQSSRGALFYKDYHLYGLSSGTLEPLDWSVPANQIYSYTSGNPTGPYPVYSSAEGTVMVMDYAMSATQTWVGSQVPLPGAPENLLNAQSLQFAVKTNDPNAFTGGSIVAYVQIGAVSEDLEGSGKLESALSAANNMFQFHTQGMTLLSGGGAPPGNQALTPTGAVSLRSEDFNGNGILDLETPALVATYQIPISATSGWQNVEFDFTPAQRAALSNANAIRIILVNSSGGNVSGLFEVSSFSIAGSPFQVGVPSGQTSSVNVQEIPDPNPVGQQLVNRYPEVNTVFHANGQTQKVLNVSWSGISTTTPAWTITGYPNPVDGSIYRELVFYMLTSSLTPSGIPEATVNLTDQNGSGVHATIPLSADGVWHKYVVDLDARTLQVDGHASGDTVSVDGRSARFTTFSVALANATGGNISIDEVSLQGTKISLAAGAILNATYTRPGTLLSIGGVPVVSDLKITEQSAATGPGFASGFEDYPASGASSSYTALAAKLPFVSVDTNFGVARASGVTTLSGGHSLTFPLGPVTLQDSYSQTENGYLSSFARSDSVSLALPSVLQTTLQTSAVSLSSGLNQSIGGTISSAAPGPLALSATATLTNSLPSFTPYSLLYFPNWADSFRLFLPNVTAGSQRTASFGLNSALQLLRSRSAAGALPPPNPVGAAPATAPVGGIGSATEALGGGPGPRGTTSVSIDLQPSGGFQSIPTGGRSQTNAAALSLSLPVSTPSGLLVTPSYTRTWSSSLPALSNADYADDFSTYFSNLSRASFLYDTIPIEELFAGRVEGQFAADSAGQTSASYQPAVSLALDRSAGSRLTDLIVPVHLGTSLTRTIARQNDTVNDSLGWQVTYRTDALNLFGSAGVYPVFRFYRTDEIATSINVSGGTGPVDSILQNLVNLYMTGNRELDFTNRAEVVWDSPRLVNDSFTTSYSYRIAEGRLFTLPYIPKDFQEGRYLENTESVTFTTAPDVIENSFQITLNHETAFVLPDHGKISANAGIGLQENKVGPSERVYLFGFQASIRADLVF